MSSTLIKNNFRPVSYRTIKQSSCSVSLPIHKERNKVIGPPPPLSMLDKLERIQERHHSDPPNTSDLKPYQISMGGNDHSKVHFPSSVLSVIKSNHSKGAKSQKNNHLPLAEFMSF